MRMSEVKTSSPPSISGRLVANQTRSNLASSNLFHLQDRIFILKPLHDTDQPG